MNEEEQTTNKKSPKAFDVEVGRMQKTHKSARTTDNTIAQDKEFVHGLHVLVCKVLGLDDEDHEDDELAEPLEKAIIQLVLARDSTGSGELSDLYSNKNISLAVRDIFNGVNAEYEPGADDYGEALKSRFMLLARRMRDRYESHTQQIALKAQIKILEDLPQSGIVAIDGLRASVVKTSDISRIISNLKQAQEKTKDDH